MELSLAHLVGDKSDDQVCRVYIISLYVTIPYCRLTLDVKYMLSPVLQSHSLDLFAVMGSKSVERLVEVMDIYQVYRYEL